MRMLKERYKKGADLGNNFFECTDNHQRKVRLLKIIPVSKFQKQQIFQCVEKLIQIAHPNVIKIYDCFHGFEELNLEINQIKQIQKIRVIYLILEYPQGGFLYRYVKILKRQQMANIYEKLKLVTTFLHQHDLSGNIQIQNILIDKDLNPLVYLEVKDLINKSKIKNQFKYTEQNVEQAIKNLMRSDLFSIKCVIYEIATGKLTKKELETNNQEVVNQIIENTVKQIIGNNESLEKIIEQNAQKSIKQLYKIPEKRLERLQKRKMERQRIHLIKNANGSQKNTFGHWTKIQKRKSYQFILQYKQLQSQNFMSMIMFQQMSKFLKTRDIKQCLNFCYRLKAKVGGTDNIIDYCLTELKQF